MSSSERTPRLGRGLAALMGEVQSPAPTAAGRELAIDLLEANPFQPRGSIDDGGLEELAASIRTSGILQPLLARPHPTLPGRYQLVAGERRWRAAQAAGLHHVPVLIRDMPDRDAMAAALVENLQRQDLNAVEEATGYRRLMAEFGLTQEELAQAVGKSRSHVANTLRLLKLPKSVQHHLGTGALTAGHARALLSHPDPKEMADLVIARGLNVRQTEALLDRGDRRPRAERTNDPETAALARDLSQRLGVRVDIAFDGRGGVVRLHYGSLDQLDGLVVLLSR